MARGTPQEKNFKALAAFVGPVNTNWFFAILTTETQLKKTQISHGGEVP